MEPGLAQDTVLCDIVWSDVSYGDYHADVPADPETHRENNVAYGDGHAETHYHTPIQDSIGYWYWEEHYVMRGTQYLLY
jgi:prepilin-type processing-associated H-X9-DG protein